MQPLMILMLILILACGLCVALTRNLLVAAVVFMAQSLAMSVVWILLQSPDLAITQAAVGAGIDSLLLFVTLRRIHAVDAAAQQEEGQAAPEEGGALHGENP
ncbi:MAG: DUF4040 domain-containing protein [Clostridia bacterium]|nr:DUF4040 domain-containing protein [Clostridia bacterium]